jgi:peptidylprolyl isomerase
MTPGKGKKIKEGSHVSLHYTGSLLDGTIFDSSYPREKPFELEVGKGQVIPGFDEALLLMQEGEKAKIIIPSKLAYEERGAGGVIPPYTPIVFEIEVLDVE